MNFTVRLEKATLRQVLGELLPLRILLDDDSAAEGETERARWFDIGQFQTLELIENEGLRLVTSGQLSWTAAGVPLTVTLQSLQLILRPCIEPEKHGGRLIFRPAIEEMDLKNVPGLLDRGIAALVNGQLDKRGHELAWEFGRLLDVAVPMPRTLVGVSNVEIGVRAASLQIRADAIELTMTVSLHFGRSGSGDGPK